MNNSLKSDKLLSRYLLKVVQPGILRRNNLKIRRQDVKNGCECSSIAVRQKQSPLYLHTLGPEPAVQESFLYETRSQYCSVFGPLNYIQTTFKIEENHVKVKVLVQFVARVLKIFHK